MAQTEHNTNNFSITTLNNDKYVSKENLAYAWGKIKSYVDTNGGKIDSISVNGTTQTITNKNVNIEIPTPVTTRTTTLNNGKQIEFLNSNGQTTSTFKMYVSNSVIHIEME